MDLRLNQYWRHNDWLTTLAILLLLAIGLTQIYGVALGRGGINLLAFRKQIIFAAIGLVGYVALSLVDYHRWRSYAPYLYILALLLLIGVLLFGNSVHGTKGWFNILGLGIQPVEFVKIILIISLAAYFSGRTVRLQQFKSFLVGGLAVAILVLLVLLQPDFGSALLLIAIWLFLLLAAGFNRKYFYSLIIIGFVCAVVGWLFLFTDIQKNRFRSFINPNYNVSGQSYNINQAMIAVGSGRLLGRGLGFGSQTQLKFLPEAQTDFIFAVIAEERGFLGAGLVLLLFAVIIYRVLVALPKVKDDFGCFVIVGAIGLLATEVFVNLAMNIGLLPVVGLALPLVSYGGSSLISTLLLLGLINSIIIRSKI
ncbi:MAG TPA: FtsW/RodA/SpoVE family cell cycle protein [bacterium]|jgi:rod shape determining protein RodA|nr:FtsW/RodA/SpoVE family cell cycle protein [bacterium]HRS72942.1 FtsW/RodA/SpoVE family cell cycle protein [Patescibacteria group bacterium]HOR69134.1 FtsW/RodA/SpoVE family cell cycle protein [bacterium]HOS99209.1 FtsW/RodA/SpoVE family cell cycle protein [bacterium]HPD03272.1 FtsW/RodA/SpoVE family cell cycle protein [bacterium]